MRLIKSFLPVLVFAFLYYGCQKADNPASHTSPTVNNKVNTVTIYSPENVATKTVTSDTLITSFKSLAALLQAPSPTVETTGPLTPSPDYLGSIYEGYTKTYDCSSNNWTYVYKWSITLGIVSTPSGSGELTVGTYSTSAPFQIVGTGAGDPRGTKYYIQYTVTVPNDANYCSSTVLQEMISFTYTVPGRLGLPPVTYSAGSSNSESADPSVYQTYSDVVGGFSSNGNGTYQLDVTPGVLACGTACHVSALGFPPTVTFYYSLEGSGIWQSFSQAGDNLSEFFITLPQAGTYDYYTQEDTAPGVLSVQLGSGSITVQ